MSGKSHRSTGDAVPEEQNDLVTYSTALFVFCFLLLFIVMVFCHGAILHTQLTALRALWVTLLILLCSSLLPSNILLVLTYSDTSLDGDKYGAQRTAQVLEPEE